MAKEVSVAAPAKRFDELRFYDDMTGQLKTLAGLVHCAAEATLKAGDGRIAYTLLVAEDKLEDALEMMRIWDKESRTPRQQADQARVDAAKALLGIGGPAPLNAAARARLRRLLAESDPKRRKACRRAA